MSIWGELGGLSEENGELEINTEEMWEKGAIDFMVDLNIRGGKRNDILR